MCIRMCVKLCTTFRSDLLAYFQIFSSCKWIKIKIIWTWFYIDGVDWNQRRINIIQKMYKISVFFYKIFWKRMTVANLHLELLYTCSIVSLFEIHQWNQSAFWKQLYLCNIFCLLSLPSNWTYFFLIWQLNHLKSFKTKQNLTNMYVIPNEFLYLPFHQFSMFKFIE